MRRNLQNKIKTAVGAAIVAAAVPAATVFAAPPVYKSNTQEDFYLSRIVPGESRLEWTYEGTKTPIKLIVQYGNLTDFQLYEMRNGLDGGGWNTLVYDGLTSELEWEGDKVLMPQEKMETGVNIANNSIARIDFVVIYDDGTFTPTRTNYARCVESTPYLTGAATECRAEKTATGLQYQPYDSEGNRQELSENEDMILTVTTERWQASEGAWPEKFYNDTYELDLVDVAAILGTNGGDDSGAGNGSETDNGSESGGSGSNGSEMENNGNSGTEGDNNDNRQTENNNDETSRSDSNSGAATGSEGDVLNIGMNSGVNGSNLGNSDVKNDAEVSANYSDGFWEIARARGDYAGNITSGEVSDADVRTADEIASTSENNVKDSNDTSETDSSDGDDVGVPDLGKESGKLAGIWQPMLLILAAMAAIFGWWFLVFGKRKKDKEKGEEKV